MSYLTPNDRAHGDGVPAPLQALAAEAARDHSDLALVRRHPYEHARAGLSKIREAL